MVTLGQQDGYSMDDSDLTDRPASHRRRVLPRHLHGGCRVAEYDWRDCRILAVFSGLGFELFRVLGLGRRVRCLRNLKTLALRRCLSMSKDNA